MKVIFKNEVYRIIEVADEDYSLENLKGDCYKPEVNDDIDPAELRQEELDFEKKVGEEGVFGYELQKIVMGGHEHVDSCYGFVGAFDKDYNIHYIVAEMIESGVALYVQHYGISAEKARKMLSLTKGEKKS